MQLIKIIFLPTERIQIFIDLSPNAFTFGPKNYEIKENAITGTKEITIIGDNPGSCCFDIFVPWRYKTTVYKWNGELFAESNISFESPQYRFQAIQDADRETLYGNFDKALSLYQETIFNDKLEWWTLERRRYEINQFHGSYQQITPTPSRYPSEDPTERPRLAAYAYYRIMLLHIVRGYDLDASATYDILQQKFPTGNPGYPYVEMATAFWDAYQSTHNMTNACGAAIEYAAEHPEILVPLGSDYHGLQSHKYKPEDVCPFR